MMPELMPILVPRINPNEIDARLLELNVREGQRVSAGDPIATLETTKSTGEMVAPGDGYIVGLAASAGATLRSGDVLCYLADDARAPIPQSSSRVESQPDLPTGLRITRPALELARQAGIPLDQLPGGSLVTEAQIRQLVRDSSPQKSSSQPARQAFSQDALVVYGGGGHGKMVIELLRAVGAYELIGVIDDSLPAGSQVIDLPVLGGAGHLAELAASGLRQAANAVGGIGNIGVRIQVFERLAKAGLSFPALVHPAAWVEKSSRQEDGSQVLAHAYVGSDARVGFGTIVNTGAIVSHDCLLGEFVNISPGAILAGSVQVGARSLVGMGATINLEVKVGGGARIGNGATVKADVPDGTVVRAGTIWPER